jgi:hypothetical protein
MLKGYDHFTIKFIQPKIKNVKLFKLFKLLKTDYEYQQF